MWRGPCAWIRAWPPLWTWPRQPCRRRCFDRRYPLWPARRSCEVVFAVRQIEGNLDEDTGERFAHVLNVSDVGTADAGGELVRLFDEGRRYFLGGHRRHRA